MKIDVIEEVAEGRARVEWGTVRSKHADLELVIYVFRDAMKFDGVPALTWDWEPLSKKDPWYTDELFNGVRLPATAEQLQMIADLTGCLMLTPKVVDLIWQQAEIKFDSVTQTQSYPDEDIGDDNGVIVANSHIHVLHQRLEYFIKKHGPDDGVKLIDSVGKYWVLINGLGTRTGRNRFGTATACNYGWPSSRGAYAGVTSGSKVWQPPGFKHDHKHWDPSQTIRLMYHKALLLKAGSPAEIVLLKDIATDPERASLINHEGVLTCLRQSVVPEPANDIAMPMYAPNLAA